MRSNTSVLAVFVLISSALAAPVINRPVARRSVARRSAQAILSKPAPAVCATEDANGPSWSEELCAKMPHVTGFVEAGTDSCTRPKSVGGGTGTCYIKSDKPISRVYRRMMPVPEDAQKAPGPLNTPGATSPSSDPPMDAPPAEGPTPPGLPDVSASTTSPPDDTSSSVSAPAGPTSTSSTEAPAATPTDGPINSSQPPVIATTNPDGPSQPQPNPIPPPSNSTVTPVGGTEPKDASTPPDVSPPTEDPAAAPVGPNGPDSLHPAQAPFSIPKPKSTGLPVPESVEEPVPSSSPSTDVQPAPTSSTVPAANVPIPHGTEGTWGGTLVNTINGLNSPKSGARVQAKHGTQKLSRVVGSLFFDLVYGRFLF